MRQALAQAILMASHLRSLNSVASAFEAELGKKVSIRRPRSCRSAWQTCSLLCTAFTLKLSPEWASSMVGS